MFLNLVQVTFEKRTFDMTAQVVLHDLAVEDFQQTWGAPFKYLISSEVNPNCAYNFACIMAYAHLLVTECAVVLEL